MQRVRIVAIISKLDGVAPLIAHPPFASFVKISVTIELMMQFGNPSVFRLS